MSEEAEQVDKDIAQAEEVPMSDQEKRKHLQNLREAMQRLQTGATLTNAETDVKRINEKYREVLDEYTQKVAEHEQRLRERQSRLPIDHSTLPFRKNLEEEGGAELVEYIKHNLPWLRLIILLYGGISDQGLATYAMQYDEIAAILQLEDTQRAYYIEQLRQREYWKENWDSSDDVVYALAVYLDNECGKLSKQAAKYTPEFTSHAIFNDSPLTYTLLNALRQRKHPSTLKDPFWEIWRSTGPELRRVHALLALLVLDTQPAIDTLIQSLKTPATSTLAELVLNQLRLRKHTLKDVLIILGKKAEIGKSLEQLKDTLEDDKWGDLVELFFRTFTSVMPLPVKYDDLLLSSASSIPRINAEIWVYWLSGFFGEDGTSSYEGILDTIGQEIKSAPALLALQSAYNRKNKTLTQWHPLAIPPLYENDADIVGEALTIAHQSSSAAMKGLFYIGTIIHTGVNYDDYPGLKEDALAATLFIPLEFRYTVIVNLDGELAELYTHEFIDQLIERILLLKDTVIKARALWRVALYHQYHPIWKNFNLWDLSIDAAEKINKPLQRLRALERLVKHVPLRQQERLKNEALAAAMNINDPNNKARALARLALYENNEKHWQLLAEALTTSEEISSEMQRIDTLQMLHPYITENYQLMQVYDNIVQNVSSQWYRNKGQNLLSLQLLSFHEQLHEPEKLMPVILASFIDEILALKPQQAEREDLWSNLLDSTKREEALSTLLKTASLNGLAGLYMTSKVFDVIDALLASKEISAIYILLPYLRGVEPSLLPLLNNWVSKKPDALVWAYAGLLLAETGKVDANTIPCLLELIKSGYDLGRYRASIILHGPLIFIENKNRAFRTSQLDIQSFSLLAEGYEQLLAQKMPLATLITWTSLNMIHDDPIVLRQLIERASTEERIEGGVSHLLRHISYCDASCLNELVKQFEEGSEKTQELLLDSWVTLSQVYFQENITLEQKKRMAEAISKLSKRTLENFVVIPERLDTITTLLTYTSKKIKKNEIALQQAIPILNQELSDRALKLAETSVEEFGKHTYYKLDFDPPKALGAAQIISADSTSLELLFAWLAASLREDLNDFPLRYQRISTLLQLAGATTHFSEVAIYTLIKKNAMEPLLIDAIMYHRSFWGRAGAATLVAYLRQTTEEFENALLYGLEDVAEVQTAIIQMAQKLRYLDDRTITRMIHQLEDKNASVVYTVSILLANIARNENSSYLTRQMIAGALSHAIQRSDSARPVFLLGNAIPSVFIRDVGRLDHQLYKAIIDIIGII